jgi:isoleucyl-tRNA synthetase
VLEKMKGKDLVGKRYVPLFDFFKDREAQNCFTVIAGTFVTKDSGTGVVHCAPGFGEEDYKVCLESGLVKAGNAVMPMNNDGEFTD